jgi:hypothetical protein
MKEQDHHKDSKTQRTARVSDRIHEILKIKSKGVLWLSFVKLQEWELWESWEIWEGWGTLHLPNLVNPVKRFCGSLCL